ncbi:MAG: polyprenyl synthetase family protein [Alphaproteobacteria bacterium]
MQNMETRLSDAADRVTTALDQLLPKPQGPEGQLMSAMRYAALGNGKRLRPFFTIEAGALFDADDNALLRTACAIECVHTYSLVHDDLPCMDDDDLRRGQPSTHKQFDEVTALLAGDALLTFAFEILADPATHRDPQMRGLLIAGLAKAAGPSGMVAGQMIDMLGDAKDLTLPTVARMNRLKTGALICFSVEAGALIGGADDEARQALTRFANDVGSAFQMVDDILDVESSAAIAGKATNKDLSQGKVNYVTLLGLEQAKDRVRLLAAQAKSQSVDFWATGADSPRYRRFCARSSVLIWAEKAQSA